MKKIVLLLLVLLMLNPLWSLFGKNKVQQNVIEWSVIKTLHFDIYFEKGNDDFGKAAALMAEEAYYYLKEGFQRPIRRRIPLIFYASNQDFETTNIIPNLLSEGVGGFTESRRNRVAIPFSGSYREMEKTLVHELTHAYINELNSSRNSLFNFSGLPFWFSEGLPEFFAVAGEDTDNNVYVLDLIFNEKIPELNYLGGFYAYRLGELFTTYLSAEYGRDKVIDLFYALRISNNQEIAIKKVFDIEFEELQKRWHNHLKRKYSGYMLEYEVPYEAYEQLTFHHEDGSGMNTPVKFVPETGEYLYFSNLKIHRDIWKNSLIDPQRPVQIIEGETSGKIEEFHFQKNNLAFFPDGDRFAFAAKTSFGDVIHIASLRQKKILESLEIPDVDVIYELSINSSGQKIAFGGQKNFASDIYLYDLPTQKLTQITDDSYYDGQPSWSPGDDKLAFVSERTKKATNFESQVFYELSRDIYYYDFIENNFYQVTNEAANNTQPLWDSSGEKILFLHEDEVTQNFEVIDLVAAQRARVTNSLGSVASGDLSLSDDEMIISVFYDRGWDIYLVANPLADLQYQAIRQPALVDLRDDFFQRFQLEQYRYYGEREREFQRELPEIRKNITRLNLGDVMLQDSLAREYNYNLDARPIEVKTPEIADYKTRFFLDNIWGGLAYSPSGGTYAQLQFSMSDLMGDQAFGVNLGITGSLENSNLQLSYLYLAHRIDYGIGGLYLNDEIIYQFMNGDGSGVYGYLRERERDFGLMSTVRYPFNKFWRLDLDMLIYRHEVNYDWSTDLNNWQEDYIDPAILAEYQIEAIEENIIAPQLSLNFDNAIYGATGPISGWKSAILLRYNYSNLKENTLLYSDIRRYLFFNKRYALAGRLLGGKIFGETDTRFDLDYYNGVRGYYDEENQGRNKFVASAELRFPFLDNITMAFPLPIFLNNIRGSAFIDAGAVWDDSELDLYEKGEFDDLKIGVGFGPRINLGYFVLKLDVAWQLKMNNSSKPSYYLSLSPDF
ncbi:MAG: BamA/TamA family outer membrane protein [Candidatus Cloacimonadales bacterium]